MRNIIRHFSLAVSSSVFISLALTPVMARAMFIAQSFHAVIWHSGDAPAKLKAEAFYSLLSIAVLHLPCRSKFQAALVARALVITFHRLAEMTLITVAARRLRNELTQGGAL